ncbi:MAG: sporulation protein [Deltaproteobacteria bacterium]|nr:sporulation protein [Deltaproteobacteria bacterium]
MAISEVLGRAADSFTARRVFSEPVQQDGSTVVFAAKVRGGAGGGERMGAEGQLGSGFGFEGRPAGAFAIKQGQVRWYPAIDVNRIILGGQVVALGALLLVRALVRAGVIRSLGGGRRRRSLLHALR